MAPEKINTLYIDAIFFLKKTLLFYAYGYFAFMYACAACKCSTQGGQKRTSDPQT